MPINGAVWRGKIRIVLAAVGSLSGPSTGATDWVVNLNAYTLFAPNSVSAATGFSLSVHTGSTGGVPYGDGYYDGPGAPFGGLYLSAVGGGTLELLLEDVTVWCRNTGALPQIDANLYVNWNGSAELGPISISEVGAGVGPNYVPLLGCIGATGDCFSSTIGADPNNFAWDLTTTGSMDLAYEVQEEGSSTWLPMPLSLLSSFVVSGSDTSNIHFEVYRTDNTEYSDTTVGSGDGSGAVHDFHNYESTTGEILFVPSGDRSLEIMAPDYRSTIYRSGYPQTTSYAASGSVSYSGALPPDGWDTPVPVITEVHPSLSAFKGSAGDASHVVFDPLHYPCYACVVSDKRQSSKTFDVTYGPGGVPTSGSNSGNSSFDSFSFPDSVEDYDTNPYLTDWQYHMDPYLRYFGSWGSPYWKLGEWFPPAAIDDEGGQAPQSQWPLDGGSVSPQYWKQIRSQWAGESSLPEGELTKKRTDLIGSAVEASALTLVYDEYWTDGFLRPLGWSRSPVMDCGTASTGPYEACPNSLDLRADSEPSWSSTDSTLGFGSGITVTPDDPGQTTAKVSLSLNGWAGPPYLYPQSCGSVTVGYTAPALSLRFLSALGGSATVTGVTDGQTVDYPSGTDSGYAGTWGIDNGAGFTSDTGSDVAPGGQSLATMADPSRAQSFGALLGRQAATLEFTITFERDGDDEAIPATLDYPTFHRAEGDPFVVYLTGAQSAILWPDGPAILYGNEFYWDGLSFNEPPLLTGLGYSPTIIDAIGWRRAFLQGVSPLSGGTTGTGAGTTIPALTTELAERYTSFEGQSIAQVDQMSWTFVLPSFDGAIRLLLGNTYQEVPPLAMFMAKSRAAGTYASSGDPWGGVYALAKEPRDVVAPTTALKVYDDSDALVSTAQTAPDGWKIERYSPAIENDEGDWSLKQGSTTFGHARPFHGWFWAGKAAEAIARWIATLWRGDGRAYKLVGRDEDSYLGSTHVKNLAGFTDNPLGQIASDGFLVRGEGSKVIVGLVVSDSLILANVPDDGQQPITTMTDGPAKAATGCASGDGTFWTFRNDSGTVKATKRNVKDLSVVSGPTSTNLTGLSDDADIASVHIALEGNKPGVLMLVTDAGTESAYKSADGILFS